MNYSSAADMPARWFSLLTVRRISAHRQIGWRCELLHPKLIVQRHVASE